jgi:hypothetical protein
MSGYSSSSQSSSKEQPLLQGDFIELIIKGAFIRISHFAKSFQGVFGFDTSRGCIFYIRLRAQLSASFFLVLAILLSNKLHS